MLPWLSVTELMPGPEVDDAPAVALTIIVFPAVVLEAKEAETELALEKDTPLAD
jgi:hypothetical protein